MPKEAYEFIGRISSTTPDGRSAIVKLDTVVAGKKFAVITPSSRGRIDVMNGIGRLERETRVHGRAEKGIDALNVVEFEAG